MPPMGLQSFTSGTGGFGFLHTLKWSNLNYDWYSMVPIEDHTFFVICNHHSLNHWKLHHDILGYIFFRYFYYICHIQTEVDLCLRRSLKLKICINLKFFYAMLLYVFTHLHFHTSCLFLRNNTHEASYNQNRNYTICPLSQTHLFESKPKYESSRSST